MKRVCPRLLACEKGSSHLHAFGSESERCHNSARVSNSARGDDGKFHGIDDLWHQRHGSRQGIFGRLQKGAAMAASLKAGGGNHVHTGLF
jgi:hypothetical protein